MDDLGINVTLQAISGAILRCVHAIVQFREVNLYMLWSSGIKLRVRRHYVCNIKIEAKIS